MPSWMMLMLPSPTLVMTTDFSTVVPMRCAPNLMGPVGGSVWMTPEGTYASGLPPSLAPELLPPLEELVPPELLALGPESGISATHTPPKQRAPLQSLSSVHGWPILLPPPASSLTPVLGHA